MDLRNSPEDKSQRLLNAIEPGADIPIYRHHTKDESFVILRGKVRSTTYNDKEGPFVPHEVEGILTLR